MLVRIPDNNQKIIVKTYLYLESLSEYPQLTQTMSEFRVHYSGSRDLNYLFEKKFHLKNLILGNRPV